MKLVVLGDSIAAGTYTGKSDTCPMSKAKTFGSIIAEKLGYELVNKAVNGISYKCDGSVNPDYSIINQEKNAPDCNILIISAGTNDFGINIPVGTESDFGDVSFSGAAELVFKTIYENRPRTKVVIVTPFNRVRKVNDIGVSLDEYSKVLANKANKYGFTVINGKEVPLTSQMLFDGLHPDGEGHKMIAEKLLEVLCK